MILAVCLWSEFEGEKLRGITKGGVRFLICLIFLVCFYVRIVKSNPLQLTSVKPISQAN